MRHGHAYASHVDGDRERTLTDQGKEQAAQTGQALMEAGWVPAFGLVSAAIRAHETMLSLLPNLTPAPEWELVPSFYLADERHIQKALSRRLDALPATILLVGHNPGWSSAVEHLTGTIVGLDVAEAALCSVEAKSWAEALMMNGLWTLHSILSP